MMGAFNRRQPNMGYAILRTDKLKSGIAVRRSLTHAFRERDTPNAEASRTPDNTHIGAASVDEAITKFNARLATQDKVRSNAVLAVEYLVTSSGPDMHGKSREEQDAYFRDALKWIENKHGAENVIYAGIHRDEQTPHMYAYVVPIDQRGKLNCRAFLGGAKALNQMQTEFAQEVGQPHGLQRGIEGSKARHVTVQQYYARVNKPFEPLPEVKTPMPPKLRPEPVKPGLFAGKEAGEVYRLDHSAWEREKAAMEIQKQQHIAERKAQRDAAVATAKRHQVQAREAEALRSQVDQLKRSNGVYVKKATDLTQQVGKLAAVVEMLTPDELQALEARKRQQEAERAKQAEIARQKAAEAARKAEYAKEVDRRVKGIQKLLQRGGAAHTFGVKAATALREAGDDPSKVDWSKVEGATVREAIGKHGQTPESVIEAINQNSPYRVNPASHQKVVDYVAMKAPQLRQQHEQERNTPSRGPRLG
ncbi:TPA: MobV family relaxase [Enterococcus faecalis]